MSCAAAASSELWGNGREQGFRLGLALKLLSHLTVSGLGSSGAHGIRKRLVICEAE